MFKSDLAVRRFATRISSLSTLAALAVSFLFPALTSCIASRGNALGPVTITSFAVIDGSSGQPVQTINPGQAVVLEWVVSGATSLSISDGSSPVKSAVAISGNAVQVSPTVNTTYTLTATGPSGSVSTLASSGLPAAASIRVVPAPVISSFSATPTTVASNQTVTLNWTVSYAAALSIVACNTQTYIKGTTTCEQVAVNGTSATDQLGTSTTWFTLTATSLSDIGTGQAASAEIMVTVIQAPTVTLQASKTSIVTGGSSLLTWTDTNATQLTLLAVDANNPVGIQTDVTQDSNLLVSPTISTTYTLTATSASGYSVASNSVTVTVSNCPSPEIVKFSANTPSTGPGGIVALTAIFDGRVSGDSGTATIDNNIGAVTSGTPVTSSPLASTTTFQLTVQNACGSSSQAKLRVPVGSIAFFAGDTYPGGYVGNLYALARGASGNLYSTDHTFNDVLTITPSGSVSLLAGTPGMAGYLDGSALSAQFDSPYGLAIDPVGNLYVSDTYNDFAIRKIDATTRDVSTLAGIPGNDPGGCIDFSSGGTIANACFKAAQSMLVGPDGNLYVADTGNNIIRVVAPSGIITLLAGTTPTATNPSGAGFADGTGSKAMFNVPSGITLGVDGNLYLADAANRVIRKITLPDGVVTTIAGQPGKPGNLDGTGWSDGSTGTASFTAPNAITSDASGTLYVADSNTIRRITPQNGGYAVDTIIGTPGGQDGLPPGTAGSPSVPLPGPNFQAFSILANPDGNLYMTTNVNGYGVILTAPY